MVILMSRESTRGDILLYLLTHLILSKRNSSVSKGCASTPWTEYIKFLPRSISVPTMWTSEERELLQGTSLEVINAPSFTTALKLVTFSTLRIRYVSWHVNGSCYSILY